MKVDVGCPHAGAVEAVRVIPPQIRAMTGRGLDRAVSDGLCKRSGVDPERWFPSTEDASVLAGEALVGARRYAERVCAGCPARAACLEKAMRGGAFGDFGIWAGLTSADRRAVRPLWAGSGPEPATPAEEQDVVDEEVSDATAA